jgi:hypothetical protein
MADAVSAPTVTAEDEFLEATLTLPALLLKAYTTLPGVVCVDAELIVTAPAPDEL